MHINSGDTELYYEDQGAGRPVVLIHGWPLSGASWEKQVPALVNAGCRVITYDRRGFGGSGRPAAGYDADTFAEDLNQLMETLDLHDAVLVGFSMGGVEAARYLGRHGSARVGGAVFMSAVTPYLLKTPDNPQGMDAGVFDGIRKALAADRPALVSAFLGNFYNKDVLTGRISEEALRHSWNIGMAASPKATLDCVDTWLTDFRGDLRRIDVPTLVVHGDADRILPLEATAKRMKEFVKDSRLAVIPGGPHGLNWTHAEEVNRELLAFIAQLKPVRETAAAGAGRGRK